MSKAAQITTTGGRDATTRHIPPTLALSVGMPSCEAPKNWKWAQLTSLARLESGHTPSRKHPEWWGGAIPWIGIRDARAHDGQEIHDTEETTNELGIENSSARVLPKHTVCLSRTASVGYVVVMGRPMATSQDFVNWVCSAQLDHNFLKYLFISEGENLLRFASGSVHQTIYFPEVKAFHICYPSLPEQQRIVGILDEAFEGIATAKANAEKNLQNARALFESHLQSVFTHRGPGWVEKPFAELCDIKHGYAFEGEFFATEGDYVLLTPGNFYEKGGYRDRGEKQKYYNGEIPRDYVLNEGDMLVAMTEQASGLLGSPLLVPESHKFLHNQRLGLVISKAGVPWTNEFFFYAFNTRSVRQAIHDSASGVKVRHTSPTKIGEVSVAFPTSLSEQRRITARLDALQTETRRLEALYAKKIAALDELKSALLHQAFSGQL
jgi:type I restriction enzyme S subunit